MHKINIIFEFQIDRRMAGDSISYDSTGYTNIDTTYRVTPIIEMKPSTTNSIKAIERTPFTPNWLIILITCMFILLAWIRMSSEKYLHSIFQAIFNYQTANRLFREKATNNIQPAFLLNILFFIVTGAFVLHIEYYLFQSLPYSNLFFFLINIGGGLIYINGKYFLYYLIGFLFKTENETDEFIFYLKSGNRIMGVFLLPIAVLLFFSSGKMYVFLLILGIIIILFVSIISLFRGIRIIARKDFSIYYLILYLCTLEILPLLVAWKILW